MGKMQLRGILIEYIGTMSDEELNSIELIFIELWLVELTVALVLGNFRNPRQSFDSS